MAITTNSIEIYERACQYRQNDYSVGYKPRDDFENYYIWIINTVFYELITKKSSCLLSNLCKVNGIYVEMQNFSIAAPECEYKSTYDLMPILDGINTAFTEGLGECLRLFSSKYIEGIFKGLSFLPNYDYVSWAISGLNALDNNIGNVLLKSAQNSIEQAGKEKTGTIKKAEPSEIILRIHDPKLTDKLNMLAENRKESNSALSAQIQQLQISLQSELKQIMAIREGIDYNIVQEAIKQLVLLFFLVSETIQYHPNEEKKESYHNLIESCEDFLENIKQSLAMLGVTIINDIGKPFDSNKHRTAKGKQPKRDEVISRVVKIGFAYKNSVLEKAEVELSKPNNNHTTEG